MSELRAAELARLREMAAGLTHLKTDWIVEVRYPHWSIPQLWRNDEKAARNQVVFHRKRGATAKLLRQEFYAGPQVEVEV